MSRFVHGFSEIVHIIASKVPMPHFNTYTDIHIVPSATMIYSTSFIPLIVCNNLILITKLFGNIVK